jgi:hypothetical protein
MAGNWFEKHPKKTIGVMVILAFIGIILGAEKLLKYKNHGFGFNYNLPNRAIMLREYRPNMRLRWQAGITETNYDTLKRQEYLLRIDDDGFIMPSKKYEHPDIALLFLGGSTTECRFVEEENRFPYLTGVLLEKAFNIKVNSYNGARSGNHSLHSMDILLNKGFPLKPNIAIMMHNINDLNILLYEKSYWNRNLSRSVIFDINQEIVANFFKIIRDRWIPNLAAALHNFDKWLRSLRKEKAAASNQDEFAQVRGQTLKIDEDALNKEFAMNLQAFIDLCRARQVTPVLMTMASRLKDKPDGIIAGTVQKSSIDYATYKALFDSFNETIRRKGRENGVLVIDLAKVTPQEKEYLYDIVHHNDRGSIMTAEIIKEQLSPLIKQLITKH